MSSIFSRAVFILVWIVAILCVPMTGAATAHPIAELQHTAWTAFEGAPPDIWALAQTADGYLWLGTGDGLYRFDGVRFEQIVPKGAGFPHTDIVSLLATRNDDLMIGYQDGGVSLLGKAGLANFAGFPRVSVHRMVEDASGQIWVLSFTTVDRGGLQRFSRGRWERVTAGLPSSAAAADISVGPDGTIWLLVDGYLYTLAPGQKAFSKSHIDPFAGVRHADMSMAETFGYLLFAPDSSLWLVSHRSLLRVTGGPPGHASPLPIDNGHDKAIMTGDGEIWILIANRIVHLSRSANVAVGSAAAKSDIDIFGRADGLTSNSTGTIFQDRERNIWVSTNVGLERFHSSSVIAETTIDPNAAAGFRLAPAEGGGFYLVQSDRLYNLAPDGRLTSLRQVALQEHAFCSGKDNMLWTASDRALEHWRGRIPQAVPLPGHLGPRNTAACQEDKAGRLWLAVDGVGILRRDAGKWLKQPIVADPGFYGPALLVADEHGGMWESLSDGPLRLIERDRIRTFGPQQGLAVGTIGIAYAGLHGLLVGGESGLAWFDGTRFRNIRAGPDSPFRRIAGIVQTSDGQTWLNTLSGVIEIRSDDLQQAFVDGRRPIRYRLFDRRDGLPGPAQQDSYSQTAFQAPDGRLWFITNQGIARIDPQNLSFNRLPPPVVIQNLVAENLRYDPRSRPALPPGTSSIRIDYTALSLRMPERLSFRYMLEGVDPHWIDPGRRRQAFYTRLGPGDYVFRVIAANDSGVWNKRGAEMHFSIRPTFTETAAFRIACIIAAPAAIVILFLLNARRLAQRLRDRLGERLQERERIARELHDTLLQGFQGLQLHFQTAVDTIPKELDARQKLDHALGLADAALIDARQRVRDLRSSGSFGGLAAHLRLQADRLPGHPPMRLTIVDEGRVRDLAPTVERETAAIAEEAIFNAARHSGGQQIEVRLSYTRWHFRLTVSDDGRGIGALADAPPEGHFGLLGMRERAGRLHGTLIIRDRPQGGTEVKFTLAGFSAYGRAAWLLGDLLAG